MDRVINAVVHHLVPDITANHVHKVIKHKSHKIPNWVQTKLFSHIKTDACSSSPCKNGGACTPIGSTYQCNCPSNCQGYDCSYCPGNPSTSCKDFNSNVCKTYAALGYCNTNSYVNGALFKVSCALSCNACTTTNAPATCVDTQANCVYWANLCHLIPYPNPCRKTCKLC